MDLPQDGPTATMALGYLDAGLSVVPLKPGTKVPAAKWEEFQYRKAERAEVGDWAVRFPGFNLGMVTGRISGVTVVDVDGPNGAATARGLPHRLPETLTQKTPKGWHMVYQLAPNVANSVDRDHGIDIRGEGGYIVVAPSRLENGAYDWLRRRDPAPFPTWLLDWLAKESQKPRRIEAEALDGAPGWVSHALANGAKHGGRNDTTARLAGYFFGLGMPADIVTNILTPYAKLCDPPLDAPELAAVVRSCARYAERASQAGITPAPARTQTLLGDRYTWRDQGVTVEIASVRKARDTYMGEMSVYCDLPGYPQQLHGPVLYDLMSTDARGKAARFLSGRLDLKWVDLLEVTSRLSLMSLREGDPPVMLRDVPRPNGEAYAVDPIVLSDGPTIWFGKGGTGKSYFALAAAALMDGFNDAMGGMQIAKRHRVAYLDWEWDAWVHADRMRALLGKGMEDCDVVYRRCFGPLPDQVEQLRRMIDAEGITFVIVDSIGAACGGEPEASATALRFNDAVRALGVGSLLISHVTKGGDTEHPFGSVYWTNIARATWYLHQDEDSGEIGFFNKKANLTKRAKPVGFRLDIDEAAGTVTIDRVSLTADELIDQMSISHRILAVLAREPIGIDELAEAVGSTRQVVKNKLTLMKRKGQVVNTARGSWGLAAPGQTDPRVPLNHWSDGGHDD